MKRKEDAKLEAKLLIQLPSYISHYPNKSTNAKNPIDSTLTVLAVDPNGEIDKTRNDTISMIFTSLSNPNATTVKLGNNFVKLANGEGKIGIFSKETEFIKLTALCKNKKANLQPYTSLFSTGGYPKGGYSSGRTPKC
ncbi:hypothetical protein ACFLQ6_04905 [Thermoproteota archaeon]